MEEVAAYRLVILAALATYLRGTGQSDSRTDRESRFREGMALIRSEIDSVKLSGLIQEPRVLAQAETILLEASETCLEMLDEVSDRDNPQ